VSLRLLGSALLVAGSLEDPAAVASVVGPISKALLEQLSLPSFDVASPVGRALSDAAGVAAAADPLAAEVLRQTFLAHPVAAPAAALAKWARLLTDTGAFNLTSSASSGTPLSSSCSAAAKLLTGAIPSFLLQLQHAVPLKIPSDVAAALLSDLCLLDPAQCLPSIAEHLTSAATGAAGDVATAASSTSTSSSASAASSSSVVAGVLQVQLEALQRFIDVSCAQSARWRLRGVGEAAASSSAAQEETNQLLAHAFASSLLAFASTDLPVLLACVSLLSSVSSLRPSLLLPHLSSLLSPSPPSSSSSVPPSTLNAGLGRLVVPNPAFVREVSFGPSTKRVDAGVELRMQLWRTLGGPIAALLQLPADERPAGGEGGGALAAVVLSLLQTGLADSSAEVRLLVHQSALMPLLQRVHFGAGQLASLAQRMVQAMQASPPEVSWTHTTLLFF